MSGLPISTVTAKSCAYPHASWETAESSDFMSTHQPPGGSSQGLPMSRNRCRSGTCSSNTAPGDSRWPALQKAGIDDLFSVALLSYPLGVRKPAALFYRLVLAAADAPPEKVLFVGGSVDCDITAPISHGMRAVLVRPYGLRPGEALPDGAQLIQHVRDLPALLETM